MCKAVNVIKVKKNVLLAGLRDYWVENFIAQRNIQISEKCNSDSDFEF